jgi:membrane protease YdiL (CAAX protease family)
MAAPTLLQPAGDARDLGPVDRPDAWRWLATAVGGYVMGTVAALVLATIGAAIAGTPGGVSALSKAPEPPVWFVAVGLIGLWAGMGGAAKVVTLSGRHLGFVFRPTDVCFVALGPALQVVIYLCYQPFHPQNFSKPVNSLLGGGSGWLLAIPAVMAIFFVPVFEELFFRGVILRAFLVLSASRVAVVGIVVSVVLDGALFGLAHLGNDSWVQLPGLAFVGVVLAALAVRTGRLGPSIVTHASFNALAVLAFAAQR